MNKDITKYYITKNFPACGGAGLTSGIPEHGSLWIVQTQSTWLLSFAQKNDAVFVNNYIKLQGNLSPVSSHYEIIDATAIEAILEAFERDIKLLFGVATKPSWI